VRSLDDIAIADLFEIIDWSPFFAAWELNGKFPAILDDAKVGEAARNLFADAQAMLARAAEENWFRAAAVFGLFPANSTGDDIMVFADETRRAPRAVLHTPRQQLARREFWAYAPDETLSGAELIGERYRGIRPAPGYPAQPDHSEKATLFELRDGERQIGVTLTESFAMWPGASVCGLYFSHPESYYFGGGRIERDQVEDYAARKDWTVEQAEKWLAPILNYDPVGARTAAE
jgi:cobalamin-dependent methionine synthase I